MFIKQNSFKIEQKFASQRCTQSGHITVLNISKQIVAETYTFLIKSVAYQATNVYRSFSVLAQLTKERQLETRKLNKGPRILIKDIKTNFTDVYKASMSSGLRFRLNVRKMLIFVGLICYMLEPVFSGELLKRSSS